MQRDAGAPTVLPGRLRAVPNPARLPTVRYELARDAAVKLAVYDVGGREVRLLVDDLESTGVHRHQWDGRLGSGAPAPSGVYFARLTAGEVTHTARITLVRSRLNDLPLP